LNLPTSFFNFSQVRCCLEIWSVLGSMLLLQFASWRSVNLHLICGDFLSCEPRFYTNSIFAWYGTLFALVDRDSGPSLTFPFMLCGPRRCTKTISKILCVGRLVSWTPGPLRFQLNFCCTRKDKEIHLSNFQAYALSRKLEFFWLFGILFIWLNWRIWWLLLVILEMEMNYLWWIFVFEYWLKSWVR
jgi:hypothetical protein